MMSSLSQTLTISQLKSSRRQIVYTKPQKRSVNIQTSALARSRFSLETSAKAQTETVHER